MSNTGLIFVIRHGDVADHQGDVSLTEAGRLTAFAAGTRLADQVRESMQVVVLYAPTERTRETAEALALGLSSGLEAGKANVKIASPRAENALRNWEISVEGHVFWPTDAMHPSLPVSAEHDPFLQGFWKAEEDRIGYWMTHPNDSVESPEHVAARLGLYLESLLTGGVDQMFLLVTHSGPMRAFLREALGQDPGEPEYCEWFRVNADRVQYRGETAARVRGYPNERVV